MKVQIHGLLWSERIGRVKLMLAGGLSADNVAEAVKVVCAWAAA